MAKKPYFGSTEPEANKAMNEARAAMGLPPIPRKKMIVKKKKKKTNGNGK